MYFLADWRRKFLSWHETELGGRAGLNVQQTPRWVRKAIPQALLVGGIAKMLKIRRLHPKA